MVCRAREQGHNKTGFVTKLQQNNSLDPPVHGDTSQYHSLTEEEGGLEENSWRSSLGGHAQLGQVMLHLLKIMPGHIWVQGKNKTKIMYGNWLNKCCYSCILKHFETEHFQKLRTTCNTLAMEKWVEESFMLFLGHKYRTEIINFLRRRYFGIWIHCVFSFLQLNISNIFIFHDHVYC